MFGQRSHIFLTFSHFVPFKYHGPHSYFGLSLNYVGLTEVFRTTTLSLLSSFLYFIPLSYYLLCQWRKINGTLPPIFIAYISYVRGLGLRRKVLRCQPFLKGNGLGNYCKVVKSIQIREFSCLWNKCKSFFPRIQLKFIF